MSIKDRFCIRFIVEVVRISNHLLEMEYAHYNYLTL
jgi:hypothetical protein